jgi:hypothetical protein
VTYLLVVLVIAVFVLPLGVRRLSRPPWGPEDDLPIPYELTDRGHHAADHPTTQVLNEDDETWTAP